MALNTASYKSIGLIVGIATVGVIFVVATVMFSRTREVPVTSKAYAEPVSGLVFDAPADWTVGTASSSTVQIRAVRLNEIQSQKSTCSQFSDAITKAIRTGVENGPNTATEAWQKEFPGLVETTTVTSAGGLIVLVGIDTCNASLNQRSLTFRGQTYRNEAEIRFSLELPESSDLSQSDLRNVARGLVNGEPSKHLMSYQRFVGLLESLR